MYHTTTFRNGVLKRLPDEELERLRPHLEPIDLPRDFRIAEPDQPIEHVYFLEDGIGSIVVISPGGERAEAGMFGREGFAPTPPAVGIDITLHEVVVQSPGSGNRVALPAFWNALGESPVLAGLLAKATQNLATQAMYTALSNAVHNIEERLARWLLMCHDRVDGDQIAITHEYISVMLAVRRSSVTTALHVLEGYGFIRSERRLVTIRDRQGMERFARDLYGRPEHEYTRLFGIPQLQY